LLLLLLLLLLLFISLSTQFGNYWIYHRTVFCKLSQLKNEMSLWDSSKLVNAVNVIVTTQFVWRLFLYPANTKCNQNILSDMEDTDRWILPGPAFI